MPLCGQPRAIQTLLALTLFLGPFGPQRLVIASPDTQISNPVDADQCFTEAAEMNRLLWDFAGEQNFPHEIIAVFCIEESRRRRK